MKNQDNASVLDKLIAAAVDKQEAAAKPSVKPAGPAVDDEDGEGEQTCRCGCALTCEDCGKKPQDCSC